MLCRFRWMNRRIRCVLVRLLKDGGLAASTAHPSPPRPLSPFSPLSLASPPPPPPSDYHHVSRGSHRRLVGKAPLQA